MREKLNLHGAFNDFQHVIMTYYDDDYNLWKKSPNKPVILLKESLRHKIKVFLGLRKNIIADK
jgi:hypothetical protein